MALALDITKTEGKYIKTTEVEFKPKTGEYRYYDKDAGEEIVTDSFEGVVVGTGFQFRGNIGNPTKKKSINYLSDDFDMDTLKNGLIGVREFVRENGNLSNRPMGRKTYQEWKETGLKVHRTVYVIKEENPDVIYKLCFSAVASIDVGKAMTPDIPNFVTEFAVSDNMFETDNGEFYVPKVTRKDAIKPESEAKVGDWLVRVKESMKPGQSDKPAQAAASAKTEEIDLLKDVPF